MTLTTVVPVAEITGNGVTTVFPFTFYVAEEEHLVVYEKVIATGVLTEVAPANYVVSGVPGAGSITYNPLGVPVPSTKQVFITRVVPLAQEMDIRSQGGYDPETLEGTLDNLAMQIQQVAEEVTRKTGVDYGDTPVDVGEIADLVADAEDAAAAALAAQAAAEAAVLGDIGAAIHIAPSKSTLVNADEFAIWNSVGAVLNRFTWANMKVNIMAMFNLTSDSSPLDADRIWYGDSANSFIPLYMTFTQFKTYLSTVYAPVSVLYANMAAAALATAAEYRSNTASKLLPVASVWSAAAEVALTDAATIVVDFSTFINGSVTLAGNRALGNPTNEKVGQSGYIRITQDATGTRTLSYGTDWEFAGGVAPVLSTAIGAQDLLFYQILAVDRIYGSLVKAIA